MSFRAPCFVFRARHASHDVGVLALGLVVASCGGAVAASVSDGGVSRDAGDRHDGPASPDAATGHDSGSPGDAARDTAPVPDSSSMTRVPLNHRPDDSQCATLPAAGDCQASPSQVVDGGQFTCAMDGMCASGTNGRCNTLAPAPFAGCECDYDTCAVDTDCPSGELCACHGSPYFYGAGNTCTPGNCRVDSDCGPQGFCHTAGDTCVDDSDCGANGLMACVWLGVDAGGDGRWECQKLLICV
jgi:hypothetical protein